jgi:replicative DNA helicase
MNQPLTQTDRVLPHSAEAEKAVLGSLLLYPEVHFAEARDRLPVDAFYLSAHRDIYATILQLPKVDATLLTARLTDTGRLEEVGGPVYLADLLCNTPTSGHFDYWLELVEQKYRARLMINTAAEIMATGYDSTDIPTYLDNAEKSVLKVTATASGQATGKTMPQCTAAFMDQLAANLDADTHGVTGLPTGLGKLDRYITGLHPFYYLICARPSVGKTVLLENIARHLATNGTPVALFSLEMAAAELMYRQYSSHARVDSMAIRTGQLTATEHEQLVVAHQTLTSLPLHIDDDYGMSILEIRRRARRYVRQHGVKAIFIDYAQLIQASTRRGQENEIWGLNEISAGLKNLQRELNIPVVVAAQLNRESDKRESGAPKLSDIKGSGAFEQDADCIFILERKVKSENEDELRPTKLHINKQRSGPTGTIPLTYLKEYYTFANAQE